LGKPEGKRPVGRPRSRWVDNIKMDLREIVWGDMHRIAVAQDRDQWRDSCKHGNELSGFIKCCNYIPPLFTYFESFICLVFFSFVVSFYAFPVFLHVL
jgi:hypothetical protein